MAFRSKELAGKLLYMIKKPAFTDPFDTVLRKEAENDATDAVSARSGMGPCERCGRQIKDWKSGFYICGEYSCARKGERFEKCCVRSP
jgi:hypothetical protein